MNFMLIYNTTIRVRGGDEGKICPERVGERRKTISNTNCCNSSENIYRNPTSFSPQFAFALIFPYCLSTKIFSVCLLLHLFSGAVCFAPISVESRRHTRVWKERKVNRRKSLREWLSQRVFWLTPNPYDDLFGFSKHTTCSTWPENRTEKSHNSLLLPRSETLSKSVRYVSCFSSAHTVKWIYNANNLYICCNFEKLDYDWVHARVCEDVSDILLTIFHAISIESIAWWVQTCRKVFQIHN